MPSSRVPLSVHDLGSVSQGQSSGDALRGSIAIARAADRAGYERIWVAEHHNAASVASTSPAVLIAAIAAQTHGIRVGAGGVMLPNHEPFIVAEQFALLESLYPSRIDLALGRAAGTDPRTATAVRSAGGRQAVEQFPENVRLLTELLDHSDQRHRDLAATPAPTSRPGIWVLGSSTYGAQVAAALGLPYAYMMRGRGLEQAEQTLEIYRSKFRPSVHHPAPYVMVTASVVAADDTETAHHVARSAQLDALNVARGVIRPLVSPDEAASTPLTAEERRWLEAVPATQFVGTGPEVTAQLSAVVDAIGADEVILGGTSFGTASRITTLETVAQAWGLSPRSTAGGPSLVA